MYKTLSKVWNEQFKIHSVVGATQSPVVTLGGNARLRGTVSYTLTDSSKPVFTFKGVPFAETPVRFLPAKTLRLWNGIKDATQQG